MLHEQRLKQQAVSRPQIREALGQLLEARTSADSLKADIWTLAIEISDLLDRGCTKTILRHLVGAGYLQHAEDITRRSDSVRVFRPECPMKFGPNTCFVVTDAGIAFLDKLNIQSKEGIETFRHDPPHAIRGITTVMTPLWNSETREFSAAAQLLKRFNRPAPMLDLVLSSFEELNWPARLDDPLPPTKNSVAAERLRDTIRRLNRCQKLHRVLFSSDGMGKGIRWHWAPRIVATSHG